MVADPALQQILDTLIENAFTHCAGTATLTAREAHGSVFLNVEDEGHGIDLHEDIFQRRVSGSSRSGLVLALGRHLTEDRSGRLLLAGRMPHHPHACWSNPTRRRDPEPIRRYRDQRNMAAVAVSW